MAKFKYANKTSYSTLKQYLVFGEKLLSIFYQNTHGFLVKKTMAVISTEKNKTIKNRRNFSLFSFSFHKIDENTIFPVTEIFRFDIII